MAYATENVEIARIAERCSVLGPGMRGVIWVQGCTIGCPACVVPESHARGVLPVWSPDDLADRMLAIDDIDGITLSGGEPFLQAGGLAAAVRRMRRERPRWTFLAYSGYRRETLERRGRHERELLAGLDVLIDGPFVERLAANLLWRGSSNQRLHALTAAGRAALLDREDRSAGIETELGPNGLVTWSGVPPPGFRTAVETSLERAGLELVRTDQVTSTDDGRTT